MNYFILIKSKLHSPIITIAIGKTLAATLKKEKKEKKKTNIQHSKLNVAFKYVNKIENYFFKSVFGFF